MHYIIACFVLFVCLCQNAQASFVWTNCNSTCSGAANQISAFDVTGNVVDAHDGQFIQCQAGWSGCTSGHVYFIGTSYDCGYRYGTASSLFCGFKIYDYTDPQNPVSLGFLFDATGAVWQTNCKNGAVSGGCFRPHVIYNAANSNFVLWFNVGSVSGQPTDALYVFVCTVLSSPSCTQQTNPIGLAHPASGDFALFADAGGTAYIVYSVFSTHEIWIDKLNTNYTDSTGTTVDTGVGSAESPSMFTSGGTYFVVYSALCPYCTSAAVSYVTASSAQGTYGGATTLNATSCGGQFRSVDLIGSQWILTSDLWTGNQNQAIANTYLQSLTVSGSAITPFSCNQTVTVSSLSTSGNYPTPNNFPAGTVDQDSITNKYGYFNARSDISTSVFWAQVFVPSQASLYAIRTLIGIGYPYNTGLAGTQPATDGSFEVDLVPVTGACTFGSTIGSMTIAASSLTWSDILHTLVFNKTLTPSSSYAFIMKGVSTTNSGTFNTVLSQGPTSAYSTGHTCYSTNGGSTWSASAISGQANFAFMFQTLTNNGAASPPMGGLAANDNGLQWGERRRVAR